MITSEYNCPICNWEPREFCGTFYRVVDGEIKEDLSAWDLEETGLPLPKDYYPKYGQKHEVHNDFFGYEWEETHKCPHCNKEFTFINSNI
jgi:hypothetical protein